MTIKPPSCGRCDHHNPNIVIVTSIPSPQRRVCTSLPQICGPNAVACLHHHYITICDLDSVMHAVLVGAGSG